MTLFTTGAKRLLLAGLGLACFDVVAAQGVSVWDVHRFDFSLPGAPALPAPPDGLSGIVYLGGDEFLAVSDANAYLHRLIVRIDRSTGEVMEVRAGGGLQLRDLEGAPLLEGEHKDREDLALGPDAKAVLIVNEICGAGRPGPCLDLHELDTGRLERRIEPELGGPLEIFRQAEVNWGIEAVAALPAGRGFWVAGERALPIDGGPAGVQSGSPVRLQRLNADLTGSGQYVYVTDRISRPIESPEALMRFSGSRIVGLCVLPNGVLVALENTFQGNEVGLPETRIRLYEIDFSEATNVSGPEYAQGLKGKTLIPVSKRLLVELPFDGSTSNYEGLALGPRLDNGDYSTLLIRDNGKGLDQTIHALRIRVE